MKYWKRFLALAGVLVLTFSLAACQNGGNDTGSNDSGIQAGQSDSGQDNQGNDNTDAGSGDGSNVLVAYFSYSGNTEAVAGQIADATGGTLAEIQRAEDYTDVNTEGEEELNSNARPEITVDVDSIDAYDTIFIGYPIWWDEAPMVISTFLESYDFTGKTIAPFCTSASDPIDNSLHIFEELAPVPIFSSWIRLRISHFCVGGIPLTQSPGSGIPRSFFLMCITGTGGCICIL